MKQEELRKWCIEEAGRLMPPGYNSAEDVITFATKIYNFVLNRLT